MEKIGRRYYEDRGAKEKDPSQEAILLNKNKIPNPETISSKKLEPKIQVFNQILMYKRFSITNVTMTISAAFVLQEGLDVLQGTWPVLDIGGSSLTIL